MQVSRKLRRATGRYFHWCPGCRAHHPLPDSWDFDGNVDRPTFSPSFRQGNPDGTQCHYFIRAGRIEFCSDSAHRLAGKSVDLPDLPATT